MLNHFNSTLAIQEESPSRTGKGQHALPPAEVKSGVNADIPKLPNSLCPCKKSLDRRRFCPAYRFEENSQSRLAPTLFQRYTTVLRAAVSFGRAINIQAK